MPRSRGASYHICQSLIAVGAGGVTGRGYMEGMQKLFFLPEAHTDFIFANIAEELGFIGAIVIVLLFVLLGVRGLRAAFRSQDPFARLAAFGITTAILLQAFFNISVVLSLVPTKGIPLPLISSGGTSIFAPWPASGCCSTSLRRRTEIGKRDRGEEKTLDGRTEGARAVPGRAMTCKISIGDAFRRPIFTCFARFD